MIPDGFHFLRPWWLLAVPALLGLAWAVARQRDPRRVWRGIMDEHLLDALLVRGRRRARLEPAHLIGAAWVVASVALAGPAWRPEPNPFAEDTAALVVVVEVRESLLARDVQPTRLERGVQKLSDLLARRPDADVALVAYAGTAHRVLPLTRDHDALLTFARSLTPDLMPREGDVAADALAAARAELARTGRSGSVVLLSDGVEASQVERAAREVDVPVHVLALGRPPADLPSLERIAKATGGSVVVVAPDDRDVDALAGAAERAIGRAAGEGGGPLTYRDEGVWLLPLLLVLLLPWSRRGWAFERAGAEP